jgi:predicted HicB family RNase H-like nuclease
MKKHQTPEDVKPMTLRLPADLHEQLVTLAEREQRSLHAQIIWELRKATGGVQPR